MISRHFIGMAADSSGTGLKSLSAIVMKKLKELRASSYNAIQTCVLREFSESNQAKVPENTLRRRVCDILSVFIAAKLIQKNGKNLEWVGQVSPQYQIYARGPDPQDERRARQIILKRDILRAKIRLAIYYKANILRNQKNRNPRGTIPIPAIFLGCKNQPMISYEPGLKGGKACSLSVNCFSPVFIASPQEVISNISWPDDIVDFAIQNDSVLCQFKRFLDEDGGTE